VVEDPDSLKSLHGTTTGEDLFLSVCEAMKELELPGIKLKEVTTDGAPSMTGKKTGLMVELGENWTNKIPKFPYNLTASSTNSHSVEKL
jgi:hypothetical protein